MDIALWLYYLFFAGHIGREHGSFADSLLAACFLIASGQVLIMSIKDRLINYI